MQNLYLANSATSIDTDLLIGSDYFWDLVTGKVRTGKPGEPVAVETVFEWILNESVANKSVDSSTNLNIITCYFTYYFLIQLCHITLTI